MEDVALRNADDKEIREYATRNGHVLITKNKDFVPASQATSSPPQIGWIRTGNVSNRVLFHRLEAGWTNVIEHLKGDARVVELR